MLKAKISLLKKHKKISQSGFHIFELVFVILIIGILILIGKFTWQRINNNKKSVAESNQPAKKVQNTDKNIVYQINIPFYQHNSAGEQNAFTAITNRIPQIKKLGVNTIQLTPVHNSAYLVLDPFDVSWKYIGKTRDNQGAADERIAYLKKFVDTAHKNKMRVIMDCVFHGTAKNSPYVRLHPDWYKRDENGQMVINNFGLPQFDTSKKEVQDFAYAFVKFWVEKAGIDGCRNDMAQNIPLSFWSDLNNKAKIQKPSWLMFGEAFNKQQEYSQPNSESSQSGLYGFDGLYDFYLQAVLRGVVDGKRSPTDIKKAWEARPKRQRENFYNMIDDQNAIQRSVTLAGGNKGMLAASAVNFTLDGIPFMFNGQEIGDTTEGGPRIDETRYYNWENPPHPENSKVFRRLACIRNNNAPLRTGTTSWNIVSDDSRVVAFTKSKGKEKTLVVVNFSPNTWHGNVRVKIPRFVTDYITKKKIRTTKKSISLKMSGYSYKIISISGKSSLELKVINKKCT